MFATSEAAMRLRVIDASAPSHMTLPQKDEIRVIKICLRSPSSLFLSFRKIFWPTLILPMSQLYVQ